MRPCVKDSEISLKCGLMCFSPFPSFVLPLSCVLCLLGVKIVPSITTESSGLYSVASELSLKVVKEAFWSRHVHCKVLPADLTEDKQQSATWTGKEHRCSELVQFSSSSLKQKIFYSPHMAFHSNWILFLFLFTHLFGDHFRYQTSGCSTHRRALSIGTANTMSIKSATYYVSVVVVM